MVKFGNLTELGHKMFGEGGWTGSGQVKHRGTGDTFGVDMG